MASIRIPAPALRRAAPRPARCVLQQRRWAQVHDVRFLATTPPPPRAAADKYRARLEAKARREGFRDVDGLRSAYAHRIEAQRRSDVAVAGLGAAAGHAPADAPPPPLSATAPRAPGRAGAATAAGTASAVKPLDAILDLEKARALPERELTAVWRLRHADSPQAICAVVPAATYRAMEAAARRAPQFVLPVPHEAQGAEMHFLQWTFDAASATTTVLFTHLAEYKARAGFAQPHTTVTHHLDLAADRGLVLMRGQLVDGRGVRPEHARWLVMGLQRFYGAWDAAADAADGLSADRRERAAARRQLLEWFSTGDPRFSVEKLLEEAERMG